jgi:hypothetical protein
MGLSSLFSTCLSCDWTLYLRGCWELNSGPLEEQSMPLTAEPSLQPPKRTLKSCDSLLKCHFPQQMASIRVGGGEGLCSNGRPLRVWPCSGEYTDNTTWPLCLLGRWQSSSVGTSRKDREINICDRGVWCEIPKGPIQILCWDLFKGTMTKEDEERVYWDLAYSFRELKIYSHQWQEARPQVGRQATPWDNISETENGMGFWNFKAHPQWHTSSNNTTPPNPSQTAPSMGIQYSSIRAYGATLIRTTILCHDVLSQPYKNNQYNHLTLLRKIRRKKKSLRVRQFHFQHEVCLLNVKIVIYTPL